MDFLDIKKNLENNEFTVKCFETANEAADYLASEIKEKTVGFGGSMTLLDMGIYEKLEKDNTLFWHWKEIRRNSILIKKN